MTIDDLHAFVARGQAAQAAADEALLEGLGAELVAKAGPMELVLRPTSVMQLAALLQLALRHPGVSEDLRAAAARFLTGARTYFEDCPHVLELLRRGDDPAEDR
jgi:hypothetical protein